MADLGVKGEEHAKAEEEKKTEDGQKTTNEALRKKKEK
jgi:hypothetical protein